MSLLSRFFYKRPPDGLLELSDRVYVFDSCFTTEVLPEDIYQLYLHEIINELNEEFPESSFLAFNFREGEKRSQFAKILCEYDVTVMDYPRQYEGCPLLPLSLVHHFLRVSESWLSLGNCQNVVLLHCERGGWPLLAFVLASFLVFRKLHSSERKTLEMVYREGPKGLLQLLSPLNPFPSQLRYLQYISRRSISSEWPPPERPLSLDCLILRAIPRFDNQKGCRPIVRVFGRNLLSKDGLATQMLYSTQKKGRHVRHFRQKDSDVIKIDIQCLVQGDVVLECVHLDLDPDREVMMFRIMFNTAFIRSNILMLNSDNLDILWDSKARFPKGFRAEVLFGDVESHSPPKAHTVMLNGEEKGGLPIEAFSRVQELFNGVDWVETGDDAALWLLKQLSVLNDVKDLSMLRRMSGYSSPLDSEEENNASSIADSLDCAPEFNMLDDRSSVDSTSEEVSDLRPSEDLVKPIISTTSDRQLDSLAFSETSKDMETSTTESSTNASIPLQSSSDPDSINSQSTSPALFSKPDLQHQPPSPSNIENSQPPATDSCKGPLLQADIPPAGISSKIPPPPPPPPFSITSSNIPPLPISEQPTLDLRDPQMTGRPPPPPPPPPPPVPLGLSKDSHPTPILAMHSEGTLPPPAPPLPKLTSSTPTLGSTPPPPPPPPPLPPGSRSAHPPPPPTPPPPPLPPGSRSAHLPPPPPPLLSHVSAAAPPPPPPPFGPLMDPPPPPLLSHGSAAAVAPPPPPPPDRVPAPPPPPLLNHGSAAAAAAAPPPPPPPPPLLNHGSAAAAPPPPPPPPVRVPAPPPIFRGSAPVPPAPPPPLGHSFPVPPPPPPPSLARGSVPAPPPAPTPPPAPSLGRGSAPTPPPPLGRVSAPAPAPPPPPTITKSVSSAPPPPPIAKKPGAPPPPDLERGRTLPLRVRVSTSSSIPPKKTSLKPLHWNKVTRAMQGSLWADSSKQDSQSRAPEIDISELESLFSVASISNSANKGAGPRGSKINKPEKVQLVDLRRAYNCEIMLTKIKTPLPEMLKAILALDSTALDIDQVENLIKFCPTKEEMEMLKNYNGKKEMLGKCEQFFLELMKVPRVESKLRVFAFTITFTSQVEDLKLNLNTINAAAREVKESLKLRQIMHTILTLGNALNQGTARGSAVGFKLDSLLKLSDTRARNNKMTLMHYLCKILVENKPDLLDFSKDLMHLEPASKIQLKSLAEEMQAVSKGLEKVEQELAAAENDGDVSSGFRKVLKSFLETAEAEVRSLITLYSEVGRSADSLSQYFGEDPARCPFEQVTQTLAVFTKMFNKAHEENEQLADSEKKKLEKEALKEQAATAAANSPAWKESPARKEGIDALRAKIHSRNNQKQPS